MSWNDLKEIGNDYFKKKKYEEAIKYYDKAIKLNDSIEVLYSNKGTCEKMLKQYKQAINDYNKSLELNPKNAKNLHRLASVYILIGEIGQAKIIQEKALNLEPYNSTYKEQMESIVKIINDTERLNDKIKQENYGDAEEICKNLIEKVPEFCDFKIKYIQILLENVKLKEALTYINNNVNPSDKLKNKDFEYFTTLALYYDGQYDKAKKSIELMMKKYPDDERYKELIPKVEKIEDVKAKANEIFRQKKYEEAIEEYTKVLEFDPKNKKFNSIILANRALCYQNLKKNKEALHDSNQSIKLNPYYAKGYVKRGKVYMELEMYDDARADFQKAKDLDPSTPNIDGYLNDANKKTEKARKRDYYAILGIDRNASEQDIKKAYKRMAMKYHPDRNGESEESKKMAERKFIDVNDAYSVLSDPKKRRMYDSGADPLNPEEGGSGMHFGDASEIFKMFFGGGGGSPFSFSTGGNSGGFRTFSFGGPGGSSGGDFPFSFVFQ